MSEFDLSKRIYLAGHRGMVGSALARALKREGAADVITRTHAELDLTRQADVQAFFTEARPAYVLLAAAKVGGILTNNLLRGDFLYDNTLIAFNVIEAARAHGVEKLLFLGSSCIYPRLAPQPLTEDALLTGPLEPTNEPYAIAKIAGIKLCDAYRDQHGVSFISAMPTNLYGPNDNYDLQTSHVLPALVRKIVTARRDGDPTVTIWGSGNPLREFLHADDLADACIHLMRTYDAPGPINVGSGVEISIRRLAELIGDLVGYRGRFVFDASKPDGTPRKVMSSTLIKTSGWQPSISLREGLTRVLQDVEAQLWYRQPSGEPTPTSQP